MKTHFTSHDLFSTNITVYIATVFIKNVEMILAILYSCFMAKCNFR